jgi:hypothetical protein
VRELKWVASRRYFSCPPIFVEGHVGGPAIGFFFGIIDRYAPKVLLGTEMIRSRSVPHE